MCIVDIVIIVASVVIISMSMTMIMIGYSYWQCFSFCRLLIRITQVSQLMYIDQACLDNEVEGCNTSTCECNSGLFGPPVAQGLGPKGSYVLLLP